MSEQTQKLRYSDDELQEFKAIILEKLNQAKENYELLRSQIVAEDTNPTLKVLEEGASTLE